MIVIDSRYLKTKNSQLAINRILMAFRSTSFGPDNNSDLNER